MSRPAQDTTQDSLSTEVDVVVGADNLLPIDVTHLAELVRFALRALGATGCWSVAVVLTSDEHLRQLHRDFMGIDEETDVMTFPHGDEPGGDIVISVERAAEQAGDYGHNAAKEIDFLAVHGVLHLCGWDDDSPELRAKMLARQTEIIAAYATDRDALSG
jgi:probable rRNA maturation factor